MIRPLLSVIVPTIGRASLRRTLASIGRQPGVRRIETIVVADSHRMSAAARAALEARLPPRAPPSRVRLVAHDAGYHCWGHPQRNYGMQLAEGAWLAFLDDDDCWAPDAWVTILSALDEVRPHIFRMRYADGSVLWRQPRAEPGNVGTPMIVVPNDGRKLGRWGDRYEGDFDFIRSTLPHFPQGPAWHRETIALIRPPTLRAS